MTERHKPIFSGVDRPNTTQVPNVYFDQFLPELNGNEFKLLMYLSRRIFGFHKDSDNISLGQMLSGIRKRNGEYLDKGTGLSKPTLLRALKSLQEKGLVIAEQRRDPIRGDVATNYRLQIVGVMPKQVQNFTPPGQEMSHGLDEPPRGEKMSQGVEQNSTTPVVKNHATQKKDVQNKVNSIHHQGFSAATMPNAHGDDDLSSSSNRSSIVQRNGIPSAVKPALAQEDRTQDRYASGATSRGSAPAQRPDRTEDRSTPATPPQDQQRSHPTPTKPNPALVERLKAAGVSPRQAKRLVGEYPADRIEAALAYLPHRNAKNPGGYLVREIEDGGWMTPSAVKEEEHLNADIARRQAAAEQTAALEEERARAETARLRRVQAIMDALAPEALAELQAEAQAQVAKFSRRAIADPDSPFVRAALHNLVQDRFMRDPGPDA